GDHFGRASGAFPPGGRRPAHAPSRPAGIPGRIGGEPPVAGTEQPVPTRGRIPMRIGRGAGDLVSDLRFSDRSAEVVIRLDRHRDLVAEHDRLGRGVDADFELGLLVLLNSERAAAMLRNHDPIYPQRRVGWELERTVEAAEDVGYELLGKDLITPGI